MNMAHDGIVLNLMNTQSLVHLYLKHPHQHFHYLPQTQIHSIIVPITVRLRVFNHNHSTFSFFLAIPSLGLRSIDRQMDKYPLGLASQQKEIIRTSNPSSAGYTGIYNPANSCFMNAALQCLSNTRELRDYFLSKR